MGEPVGPSCERRVIVVDRIDSTIEYPRVDTHAPGDSACDESGERKGALRYSHRSRGGEYEELDDWINEQEAPSVERRLERDVGPCVSLAGSSPGAGQELVERVGRVILEARKEVGVIVERVDAA